METAFLQLAHMMCMLCVMLILDKYITLEKQEEDGKLEEMSGLDS